MKEEIIDNFKQIYSNNQNLTDRQKQNRVNKAVKKYEELLSTPLVKEIVVSMDWVKSRDWGMNPHAEITVEDVNGKTIRAGGYRASGAGYNKAAAVLEEILNTWAIQNLIQHDMADIQSASKDYRRGGVHWIGDFPRYSLGSETGTFYNFTINNIASSKTHDHYVITFTDVGNSMAGRKVFVPHRPAQRKVLPSQKQCPIKVDFRKML